MTGTRLLVASGTTAARSSSPCTGAPSHCPPSRRVTGPSRQATASLRLGPDGVAELRDDPLAPPARGAAA